jgi:RNA polymerase sigma-70 factor (ECF subfamily)
VDDARTAAERPLLDAARAGDRDALEALVAHYEPHVYRFGMTMCRNEADAGDVLQDTLLAMVRSLKTFRADASLSTWLYAIAHHACAKRRRRRVSAPEHIVSLDRLDGADRNRLVSPAPNPETAAVSLEQRTALDAAIRALEPAQRVVLQLRDVEGLSAAAAAEALGLSVAAVKSRLHRARLAVRAALAPLLGKPPSVAPRVDQCADVLAVLSRHLEGDLSAQDCAAMEAHIEACPPCRTACESLRQVLAMCRHSPVPDVPVSTRARLREAIRVCLASEGAQLAITDAHATPGARRRRLRATRSS